jgi:hypothetical protein
MPSIVHFRVLDYKVYILIKKERHVQSCKLVTRAKVGILMGYKGAHIYRVYMPSRARDKIMHTSHVRFDKGGFITVPDFEAIKDKMV